MLRNLKSTLYQREEKSHSLHIYKWKNVQRYRECDLDFNDTLPLMPMRRE